MNTSLIHLLQSQRWWWIGMGNSGSLSRSLPMLFSLFNLKVAVLHWCKCRFLMFTNNKSKVFICVKAIWTRVKADQKIPYYFCIHILLVIVPHRVWFFASCWALWNQSHKTVLSIGIIVTLSLILSQWLFLLESIKICAALLCKAAHKGWLLTKLRNLYP